MLNEKSKEFKTPFTFKLQRSGNTSVKKQYLVKRNSLEFCNGVKVELTKCYSTTQIKLTFISLLVYILGSKKKKCALFNVEYFEN